MEEIDELYRFKCALYKQIRDIEKQIKLLEENFQSNCNHEYVAEPRNYGCDRTEYYCTLCRKYK